MTKQIAGIFLAVTAALWATGSVAEEHGHKHQPMPKEIDAFHALLAPIWHAPAGNERSQNACAKAGEMENAASNIRSTNARPLAASVAVLKAKCAGKPAEVDAALFDVHEAFHRLIDARPQASRH